MASNSMPTSLADAVSPYTTPILPTQTTLQPSLNLAGPSSQRVIPTSDFIQDKLANGKAIPEGLKNGLIFGLLGALPVYGLEKWTNHPNMAQTLAATFEAHRPPEERVLTRMLGEGLTGALTSSGITMLIGATAGATLGWWQVSHAKTKLKKISEAKQAQMQGRFQPKPENGLQRLGLISKPIEHPDQAYQEFINKDLNSAHAFSQGALSVALMKVLPGASVMAAILGICKIMGKNWVNQEIMQEKMMEILCQPVLWVKFAALPIIGGFTALRLAPWMRAQLGIQNQTSMPTNQLAAPTGSPWEAYKASSLPPYSH